MLAHNFLTAEKLGLSEEMYQGMIMTLGMLERNELIHTTVNFPVENGFNMRRYWDHSKCGTVGCIAGWAVFLGKEKSGVWDHMTQQQIRDFSALTLPSRMNDRTVEEAAHALRTYLVTGKAEWF